jgi:hypothetical protein
MHARGTTLARVSLGGKLTEVIGSLARLGIGGGGVQKGGTGVPACMQGGWCSQCRRCRRFTSRQAMATMVAVDPCKARGAGEIEDWKGMRLCRGESNGELAVL